MIDKLCELVTLAIDPKHHDFKPNVWQTNGTDPDHSKTQILSE